jgi:LysR family hydrogen peroxide-inducible transcriptional activator
MRTSPHPFTLRQLQYVVAVADHLSFRAAAAACHVSQPSLSAQVQEIEGQLGAVLFERDTRRVLLTSAGERFVADARVLLASADRLAEVGQRLTDPLAGPLRIGVIPTIAPGVVGVVGDALRARFTRLVPRWREAQTAVLLDELARGSLDVALLARTDETAHRVDRQHERVVGVDPFVAACASDHPLASQEVVTVDELAHHRLLLLEEGHCLREHALSACRVDATLDHDFTATSLETLLTVVADGDGVTLLPRLLMGLARRRGDLAVVPLASPDARTLVLVSRPGSPLLPTLDLVADAVREAVRPVLAG